ncbi:MAG: RIP metalloprotease RseP [Candidatus Omnitrophica bacterium]|nr:RIP metalloprotease RseP [Candidatus Omnitrophota bacterium]
MIFVIIAFGVLIFIHELAHFLTAKKLGVKVDVFSLGFGPKLISFKKKDTEYRISLVPLGGYVKMAGEDLKEERKGTPDEFLSQPPVNRAKIVFAGPLGNYIFGFLLFCALFTLGLPSTGTKVGKLLNGYPAQEAGIKSGDRIVEVNGEKIRDWEELTRAIHPHPDEVIKVKVKRDSQILEFNIKTRGRELVDLLGRKKKVGLIGIVPDASDVVLLRYSLPQAVIKAAEKVYFITKTTILAIFNLFTRKLSLRESVSGPIGIFYITREALSLGFSYFLTLLAVISISLAIFNLLPIPVLDGGHLFFIMLEVIRKKPLSPRLQENLTQIGMIFLLLLVLLVSFYDFLRFFK